MDRRDFLKNSSAAVGALAIGGVSGVSWGTRNKKAW